MDALVQQFYCEILTNVDSNIKFVHLIYMSNKETGRRHTVMAESKPFIKRSIVILLSPNSFVIHVLAINQASQFSYNLMSISDSADF